MTKKEHASCNLSGQQNNATFGTKKLCNLQGQTKIMQHLMTKKIMQCLGTKKWRSISGQKNHANSQGKKTHNFLVQKIAQPLWTKKIKRRLGTKSYITLWTKKIMQPLGEKNHTTSWDEKKSCNLSGQKISRNFSGKSLCQRGQATSWDKKIIQPLKTKKSSNLQPLGPAKNNATSGDKKKSCNLSGEKNYAPNRSNCVQISPQGSKLL